MPKLDLFNLAGNDLLIVEMTSFFTFHRLSASFLSCSFKVRRVMGMTVTVTEFPMSGMVDSGCVKKGEEPTTLQRALWGFFKLVHSVIIHQEYAITPVTHFAYHILELAAFMSGLQSGMLIAHYSLKVSTSH